jgi:DNA-binding NarL/FixJ family response regulator
MTPQEPSANAATSLGLRSVVRNFIIWLHTSLLLLQYRQGRRALLFFDPPKPALTSLEWSILQALVEHVMPARISNEMNVQLAAVRAQMRSIRMKYGLPNIQVTVCLARRVGMPPRPPSDA